jgi:hypothetical protein
MLVGFAAANNNGVAQVAYMRQIAGASSSLLYYYALFETTTLAHALYCKWQHYSILQRMINRYKLFLGNPGRGIMWVRD